MILELLSEYDKTDPIDKFTKPVQIPKSSDENCPICLDNLVSKDVYCLGCEHYFHTECIGLWLAKNTSCPICREECKKYNSIISDFETKINSDHIMWKENLTKGIYEIYSDNNPNQIVLTILIEDVNLVISQVHCSTDRAIRELIKQNLDIVDAIMALSD